MLVTAEDVWLHRAQCHAHGSPAQFCPGTSEQKATIASLSRTSIAPAGKRHAAARIQATRPRCSHGGGRPRWGRGSPRGTCRRYRAVSSLSLSERSSLLGDLSAMCCMPDATMADFGCRPRPPARFASPLDGSRALRFFLTRLEARLEAMWNARATGVAPATRSGERSGPLPAAPQRDITVLCYAVRDAGSYDTHAHVTCSHVHAHVGGGWMARKKRCSSLTYTVL